MSATAPAPVEGGPGAPAAAAVGPESLGDYARALVGRRQVRRARLAADRRRADHHRDRLPDAELELPDRRQLRQPHRPGGRLRDHRHGDRLRAAAGGDRPVGRLRQRRGGRARRAADASPTTTRVRRRPALVLALVAGVGIGLLHGRDHHEARRALLRGDAGGPAGLERGRPAAHRRQGTVIIQNSFFIGFANDFLPSATAWILAVAGIVLYAGDAVLAARATRPRGARQRPGRGPVAAHRRVRHRRSWRSPTCAIRTAASRT